MVLPYGLGMPAMKRPAPQNAATARRILIGGLAQDVGIFGIASELAPLHPRNDTFPGEVFLRLGADALDQCGASRADPVALEGIADRFLPERTFRGRDKRKLRFRRPGGGGAARRSQAGPARRGRLVADRRFLALRLVRSDCLYPHRRRPSGCARAPGMPGAIPACIAPRSVSLPRYRTLAALTTLGAKRGANAGRRQSIPDHDEPWFPQLDPLSGPGQPRAATGRMRLKSGRPAGSIPPLTNSFAV
jgi:hypothetical protein